LSWIISLTKEDNHSFTMLRKKKEKREVKMVSEEAYALPGEAS
jgi:hypothetical protein